MTITVTIITSNINCNCFYFPSNNSNRNCMTAKKPQLLQTITFIKRKKNLYIAEFYNTIQKLYCFIQCGKRDPFYMN